MNKAHNALLPTRKLGGILSELLEIILSYSLMESCSLDLVSSTERSCRKRCFDLLENDVLQGSFPYKNKEHFSINLYDEKNQTYTRYGPSCFPSPETLKYES